MTGSEYAWWVVLVTALAGYAVSLGALWILAAPTAALVFVTQAFVQRRWSRDVLFV